MSPHYLVKQELVHLVESMLFTRKKWKALKRASCYVVYQLEFQTSNITIQRVHEKTPPP